MLLILEKIFNQIKHVLQPVMCLESTYLVFKAVIQLNYQCGHCGCLMVRVSYTTDWLTN